jgi:small multidrug resistance pump
MTNRMNRGREAAEAACPRILQSIVRRNHVAKDLERGAAMDAWILLALAIVLEVAGTTCMKLSGGFTKVLPSALLFVFYAAAFTALNFALRKIDVSIAYAIWAGVGTALVAVIGAVYFREHLTAFKLFSIALIIIGVVGLNLGGPKP